MAKLARCMVALIACMAAAAAGASHLTVEECFEGSDFIANAAHARENGVARDKFLGRMEDDFELIHAYPPALRWFAKDRDDEAFLVESARQVFDAPATPEQHRARFLSACLSRDDA